MSASSVFCFFARCLCNGKNIPLFGSDAIKLLGATSGAKWARNTSGMPACARTHTVGGDVAHLYCNLPLCTSDEITSHRRVAVAAIGQRRRSPTKK